MLTTIQSKTFGAKMRGINEAIDRQATITEEAGKGTDHAGDYFYAAQVVALTHLRGKRAELIEEIAEAMEAN